MEELGRSPFLQSRTTCLLVEELGREMSLVVVQKIGCVLTPALAVVQKIGWLLTLALRRRRALAMLQLHLLLLRGKSVDAIQQTLSRAQLLQLHLSVDGINHTLSRIIVTAAGARRGRSRNL